MHVTALRKALVALPLAFALLLAGCGGAEDTTTTADTPKPEPSVSTYDYEAEMNTWIEQASPRTDALIEDLTTLSQQGIAGDLFGMDDTLADLDDDIHALQALPDCPDPKVEEDLAAALALYDRAFHVTARGIEQLKPRLVDKGAALMAEANERLDRATVHMSKGATP